MDLVKRVRAVSLVVLLAVGGAAIAVAVAPSGADAETPFSVDINYQTHVKPNQLCTVSAWVLGGTPPYEYKWSGLFEGDDFYEQGVPVGSGPIYLEVWDSDGHYADREVWMEVSAGGENCTI